MNTAHRLLLPAALLCAAAAAWAAEDVFAFVPPGGRTLLAGVLASRPPAPEVNAMLAAKRTREEWQAWLRGHAGAMPALGKLSEKETATLADYMAFNLPTAPGKPLPIDGRDMVLDKCQGCHIITVVVTQDRAREAWLGTMNKPSHVQIKLSKEQREALANYLVLNAAIPIDDVPQELRAGGASY